MYPSLIFLYSPPSSTVFINLFLPLFASFLPTSTPPFHSLIFPLRLCFYSSLLPFHSPLPFFTLWFFLPNLFLFTFFRTLSDSFLTFFTSCFFHLFLSSTLRLVSFFLVKPLLFLWNNPLLDWSNDQVWHTYDRYTVTNKLIYLQIKYH